MLRVREAIIVEGKYDQIRLSSLVEGLIIPTEGFAIFRDREKRELIQKLAEERGILILTDSDSAGFLIRNHIKSFVAPERIKNAYIPEIPGKERRKHAPSKEGLLGVEGIDEKTLEEVLTAAGAGISRQENPDPISKLDLYEWGLSGGQCSAEKRRLLQQKLGLPSRLSTASLLGILNFLTTRSALLKLLETPDFAALKKQI